MASNKTRERGLREVADWGPSAQLGSSVADRGGFGLLGGGDVESRFTVEVGAGGSGSA